MKLFFLTGPFPVCVPAAAPPYPHSQFIYIALPFSMLGSVTNYKWLQWDWSLWLNLHWKAHTPSLLLWSLLIISGTRLYPQLIGRVSAEGKQSQNVSRWWTLERRSGVVTMSYHVNGMQMYTCTNRGGGMKDCGLLIGLFLLIKRIFFLH